MTAPEMHAVEALVENLREIHDIATRKLEAGKYTGGEHEHSALLGCATSRLFTIATKVETTFSVYGKYLGNLPTDILPVERGAV